MTCSTVTSAASLAVSLGASMVLAACAAGGADPDHEAATDADRSATSLVVVAEISDVSCNGAEQPVAEIRGAEPGEAIVLSSPRPIRLSAEQVAATADEAGTYRLTWRCDPSEAGQPWELRIEGERSGRRATVSFTGTARDPQRAALEIDLLEGPFLCDGRSNIVGELINAAPGEAVTFTADGADDLADGTADSEGRLTLTWDCSPDEAMTWVVTARGHESERVGQFTIVGQAPPLDDLRSITAQVHEDPFLCDGGSRVFATLSGFLAGEVVDFASPQANGMTAGRTDDAGDLPLLWTCGRDDAGTVWELTATGARSGRTITLTFAGAPPPPPPDLVVTFSEDPFRCDGETRFAATITGFTSREFVDFASPQVDALRQGQANETGTLQVRWTCGEDDVGRVWDVTATGASSERSVTFRITGGDATG